MLSDAFWGKFEKGMLYICLCVTLLYLAFLLEPNGIRVERTREYAFPPAKAQPRLQGQGPWQGQGQMVSSQLS